MPLSIKKRLEDNSDNIVFPEEIFEEYAKDISEATCSVVTVNVKQYNGSIDSSSISSLSNAISNLVSINHNIQNDLGIVGSDYLTKYEFLLESHFLPDYRFRVFFCGCSLGGYPCKIVLEQGFAEVVNQALERDGYVYVFDNSEDLRAFLLLLFQSDKFIDLLKQIIIAANRRRTSEKNEEDQ